MRPPYPPLQRAGGYGTRVVLGRKFCPGCGRWRHCCDYPRRAPDRIAPRCWVCERAQQRAYVAKRTRADRDLRNEYLRFRTEALARAAGRTYTPRNSRRKAVLERSAPLRNPRVEPGPLAKAIDAYLRRLAAEAQRDRYLGSTNQFDGSMAMQRLAELCGVSERTIYAIRHEARGTRLDTADRIALAIGTPLSLIYTEDR